MENKKKKIFPQMFDVRPVKADGNLDLEKIEKASGEVVIQKKYFSEKDIKKEYGDIFYDIRPDVSGNSADSEPIYPGADNFPESIAAVDEEKEGNQVLVRAANFQTKDGIIKDDYYPAAEFYLDEKLNDFASATDIKEDDFFTTAEKKENVSSSILNIFSTGNYPVEIGWNRKYLAFAGMAAAVFIFIFGISFFYRGINLKNFAMLTGQEAYADLAQAKNGIVRGDFDQSELEFNQAFTRFDQLAKEFDGMGKIFVESSRFIPFISKLSSGSYLAEFGKDISQIGAISGKLAQTLNSLEKSPNGGQIRLLDVFQSTSQYSQEMLEHLQSARKNLDKVNFDDVPEEQRGQLTKIKIALPEAEKYVAAFVDNNHIFSEILGGNGPRKYLLLFQNNQEMRATGGFIGSYGFADVSNGEIRKFFIDGIFNPDGQLKEKVVPPAPVQKISAAWSLHDSNWFPDFPMSAEKAAWFYEKTGGPTVDGVIALTPVVMQKLLSITGPIEMPEYGVTVDQENFVEIIQEEVEINYDKELNQPKKIISDLAPKLLDKIMEKKDFGTVAQVMKVVLESLREKQMLIYSRNYEIQQKISELGWTGEVLQSQDDYLSVINTNINGYKTDGVIEEKINHKAEIGEDGSVVDTVTITRHHNGGNSPYEWWNKVNADYLRVYVPKGSKLLEADGQTREFNGPPIDYDALSFKRDPQVQMEEEGMRIDEETGTRIYEDAGKTVFANWAYVSPQETVTIRYKYLLPFKIELASKNQAIDAYSIIMQKQSGSIGSQIESEIVFPEKYSVNWRYPDGAKQEGNRIFFEDILQTDKFFGVAFSKQE